MNNSEYIGKHTKLDEHGEPVESEGGENYQPRHESSENPWQEMADSAPEFGATKPDHAVSSESTNDSAETIDSDPLAIPEDVAERIKEYEQTYDDLLLDARKAETIEHSIRMHKKHNIPLFNIPESPTCEQFSDISTKLKESRNKLTGVIESQVARELILKKVIGESLDEIEESAIAEYVEKSKAAGVAADELQPYYMTKKDYDYCTSTKLNETEEILGKSANLLAHKWDDDDYHDAKELLKYDLARELEQFEDTEPDAPEDAKNANLFHFIEKPISLENRIKLLIAREKLAERIEQNKHYFSNNNEEEL